MKPARPSPARGRRLAAAFAVLAAILIAAPAARTAADTAVLIPSGIPGDAGSADAPILFCVGMHIEPFGAVVSDLVPKPAAPATAGSPAAPLSAAAPNPGYNDPAFYILHLGYISDILRIVESHGGRLTIQAQTPFTRVSASLTRLLLGLAESRGHEIALHFHEDAHLGGNSLNLPPSLWAAVMSEEIATIRAAGGRTIRYWSGGNLYPGLLQAASAAGLSVMSDHKNPRTQSTDPRLLSVNPWRPAGGPTAGNLDDFIRHDPDGPVIYLPDGVFADTDFSARKAEGDEAFFEAMTEGLELSLRAARPDRVNVFHLTVHPGEFRGFDAKAPFGVVDRWLAQVVDPLMRDGRGRWATLGAMADAFIDWERNHPGVDPRAGR